MLLWVMVCLAHKINDRLIHNRYLAHPLSRYEPLLKPAVMLRRWTRVMHCRPLNAIAFFAILRQSDIVSHTIG